MATVSYYCTGINAECRLNLVNIDNRFNALTSLNCSHPELINFKRQYPDWRKPSLEAGKV